MSSEANTSEDQAHGGQSHQRPEAILADIAELVQKGVKPWDVDRYLRDGPDPEGNGIVDGGQFDATERAVTRFDPNEHQSADKLTEDYFYTRDKSERQLQLEHRVEEIAHSKGESVHADRVAQIEALLEEGIAPKVDSDDDRVGVDERIDELMRHGLAIELLDAIGNLPQDLPKNNQGYDYRADLYVQVGALAARLNANNVAQETIARMEAEATKVDSDIERDRLSAGETEINLRLFEKAAATQDRPRAQEYLQRAQSGIERTKEPAARLAMLGRKLDYLMVQGYESDLDMTLSQTVSELDQVGSPGKELAYTYDRMMEAYLFRGDVDRARECLDTLRQIVPDDVEYSASRFASARIDAGEYDEPIQIIADMATTSEGRQNYTRKMIIENLAKHLGEAEASDKATKAKSDLIALLESDSSPDGQELFFGALCATNEFDRAAQVLDTISKAADEEKTYRIDSMKTSLQEAVIARGNASQIAEILSGTDQVRDYYGIQRVIAERIDKIEHGVQSDENRAILFALLEGYPMSSDYEVVRMLEQLNGIERTLGQEDKDAVIEQLLITYEGRTDAEAREVGSKAGKVMEFLTQHPEYRRDLVEKSLDISLRSKEYFSDSDIETYFGAISDIIGLDESSRERLISLSGAFKKAFEEHSVSVHGIGNFLEEVSPELLEAVTGDDPYGYGRQRVVAELMAIFAEQDDKEVVRRFSNYKLNFALHAMLTEESSNIDLFLGDDAQLRQRLDQAQDTIRKFIADEDELDIEQIEHIGQTQTGQKILDRKDAYEFALALDSMMDLETPIGRLMQSLMREGRDTPYLRRYLLSAKDPASALAAANDYLGGLDSALDATENYELGTNVYTILTAENPASIVQGLRAIDKLMGESNLGLFDQQGLKNQLLDSLRKAISQDDDLEAVLETYRTLLSDQGLSAVGEIIENLLGAEQQQDKFMLGQDFLHDVLSADNKTEFVEHWIGLMQRTDQLGDLMRGMMTDRTKGLYSSFMYTLQKAEDMDVTIDDLDEALVQLQDRGYLDRDLIATLRNSETEGLQVIILQSVMHGAPMEKVGRLESVFATIGDSKDRLLDDASPFYEYGKSFIANVLNGYVSEERGRQLAEFVKNPLYTQVADRYARMKDRVNPESYRHHVERMINTSLAEEGGAEFAASWFELITDQSSPLYRLIESDGVGMALINQLLENMNYGDPAESLVSLKESAAYLLDSGLVDDARLNSGEQLSPTDQLAVQIVMGANLATLRANMDTLRSEVPRIDEMVFSPQATYRETLLTNILQKVSQATDLRRLYEGYNIILDEGFLGQMAEQPRGLERIMRTIGDAESPTGYAKAMSALYTGKLAAASSVPDMTLRNLFVSQDAPLALVLEPIVQRLQESADPEGLLEVIQDAFTKGSEYWEQLFMLSSLEFARDIGNENGGGRSLNILYPISWVPGLHPSPDRNGGLLKLTDMDLDDRRAVSSMSVEQKRAIANLDELDDTVVAALTEIPMGRFKPDYQLAIYAAFLQDVVATSRDERARRFSDAVNRSLVAEQTAGAERSVADILPPGTFLHGSSQSYVPRTLLNGNLCGEALGEAGSRTDMTPFQADYTVLLEDDVVEGKSFRDVVESSVSAGYGDLYYIFRRDVTSYEHGLLHNTNTPWGLNHALIPVGIPSTEINGMILRDSSDPARVAELKTTILEAGFYIPLYDMEGQIIFTAEEYDEARADLNLGVPVPIWDMNWRTGEKAGSNEGGFYAVPDGNGSTREYYVKFDTQEEDKLNHIWSEVLADRLYQAFGLPVADTEVVLIEGRFAHASQIVAEAGPGDREKIATGFIMDCWLGNWDVPYNPANYITGSDGEVYRIDNGGALLFRARGARKEDELFGETVTELEVGADRERLGLGMRQEYPGLTDEMVREQTERLAAEFSDERIDELVDSVRLPRADRDLLKSRLKARRDYIVRKVLG
ncbi:hypothetical protein IT414_01955 [bacterium]|nr:hypothetical protein [bacterium]